jgi:ABC-type transporter Mla subunit MlaD
VRRKTKKALRLSAEHAAVALHLLIEDGKVAAADVRRALKNREKMIKDLRARLAALEKAAAPAARRLARAGRKAVRRARPGARRALSRAQKVARKAQGQYLGAIRRLSREARARVKAVRKTSGVAAAIKTARKLAT